MSIAPISTDTKSDAVQAQAPVSPTTSNASSASAQPAPAKRSSRRANTAERRATHNAVERARRETLNGRFLDLAAMLPNLAAVRRPSKSAIVNSSIALIHAQRRHRAVAGREIRGLKAENDALRQELNEWRQRSNLPRVEEPPRSTDLIALMNVEEEVEMGEDERRAYEMRDRSFDENEELAEDGDESFGSDQYNPYGQAPQSATATAPRLSIPNLPAQMTAQQQQQQQQQQAAAYAHQQVAIARANQMQMAANNAQRAMSQQVQPIQTPQAQLSFDPSIFASVDNYAEPKIDLYGQMFGNGTNQPTLQTSWNQNAGALLTPPGSGHGIKPSPFASTANQAFLGNYGQNGNIFNTSFIGGTLPGSEDDNLSVGSSGHEGHYVGNNSPDHHSLGSSPVDHQFAFTAPPPYGQQRRLSVNIPAQAIGVPKQASPYQTSGAPFAAMGLMM